MTYFLLSDGEIQDLLNDEEGRKVLAKVVKEYNQRLFSIAHETERLWGPAHNKLGEMNKLIRPVLERISDEKRKNKQGAPK